MTNIESTSSAGSTHVNLKKALHVIVTIVLVWAALRVIATGVDAIGVPYSTTRAEAFVLDGVERVAAGSVLYAPAPSTTMHVYNPLTYVVPALGASHAASPARLLLAGRSISLLATLIAIAAVAVWTFRISRNATLSTLAASLPLFFHELALSDFFRLRPETPALLFSIGAILLWHQRPAWRALPEIVATLCVVAFAFKQSFIAAPIAIALHGVLQKEKGAFVRFSAMYGGGLAAAILICMSIWGRAYLENVYTTMASNPWLVAEAVQHYGWGVIVKGMGLLALSIAAIFSIRRNVEHRVLVLFWLTSLCWNVISSMKVGSNFSYYAEFAFASVLVSIAALLNTLRQQHNRLVVAGTVVLAIHVIAVTALDFEHRVPRIHDTLSEDLHPYVERYSDTSQTLVLHEKLAVQLNRQLPYDWFLTELLIDQGKMQYQEIFGPLLGGRIDTVVFAKSIWTHHLEDDVLADVQRLGFQKTFESATVLEYRR